MSKITALIGISGSGKTSYAHKQWETSPHNTLIVERDGIRNLLFGYNESNISEYYNRKDINKLEQTVSEYQNMLIVKGLEEGKHVIIANTNLNRKRDLESLNKYGVEVNFKVLDVHLKVAIERDSKRRRTVGEKVIKKQHNKFKNLIKGLKKIQ